MWRRALFILSGIAAIAAQTAEYYEVQSLPGLDIEALGFSQHAGFIEISPETHGNLFFWMIEPNINTDKMILWLNGGPGCSSMDGLFLENGPFRINPDHTVNITSGGWQDHATVVFLDQPVGTGFSYTDVGGYTKNMTQIVDEFVLFIDKFFEVFPDLRNKDLYLAGESFAGTYIPYMSNRLLDLNKNSASEGYNIKGIAIGNGWISPLHQYNAYLDFAIKADLVPSHRMQYLGAIYEECKVALTNAETIHIYECERILTGILDGTVYEKDGAKYCVNMYDTRLTSLLDDGCGMAWPSDLDAVTTYLRSPELVRAVHAGKASGGWTECSQNVARNLAYTADEPAYNLLPRILEEIPVLLFSGDQDLICNVIGTEYLIGNMTWNGAKGFKTPETLDWYIDDKVVGSYTEQRNLSFVIIKNGSHMVSYDRPIETLDMINRFMGVGNNRVNGLKSHVGDKIAEEPTQDDPSSTTPPGSTISPTAGETMLPQEPENSNQEDEVEGTKHNYGWIALAGFIMLAAAIGAGYYWYGKKKNARKEYHSTAAGVTSGGLRGLFSIFSRNRRRPRPKLRLDDHDETNELYVF
ncbi:Alpha/Beta hydrolase protein [Dichotomocladium elegans]|nr:Alpha/Beta hydrolase protein [Dichotomocladium elegans]